jgi:cell division transport system permease protein
MRVIVYFIKEALRGFFQAKLMTFVSIITVAVTLFFLGLLAVTYLNLRLWLIQAEQQSGIVAFVDDRIYDTRQKLTALQNEIADFPSVAAASVVTREMAWDRFEALYGSEMLDAVDENPLPASVELVLAPGAQSNGSAGELKKRLEAMEGINGVHYSKEWIKALERMRAWFRWGTAIIAPLLILALLFTIGNTVKLTIYARRTLVSNMHYVGATDVYIRMPFILEGMLQGMVGAVIGVAALSIVRLLTANLALYWGPWYFSSAIFLTGVVFGCFGSLSAVRKFLV